MEGYIYKITSPSGRIYIGQTINLIRRLGYYKGFRTPSSKIKNQRKLYPSLIKYGWENHTFEIIETFKSDNFLLELLNSQEKYWISFYNSWHNGLNCNEGGGVFRNPNPKHTEETRKKMSISRKGRQHSKEHKLSMSISMKGIFPSMEVRKKMSDSHKGQISAAARSIIRSDGKIYISLLEAAKELGIHPDLISRRLNNKVIREENIPIKGYTFKYY